MSDEQQKKESRPSISAGAYIVNKKGEVLLMRSPKWNNLLIPPAGHIEYGETIEAALRREIKEETGLDITGIELLEPVEIINSEEFVAGPRHLICLDHRAVLADENQTPKLDGQEGTEFLWLKPEEAVKRDDLEKTTKLMIEKHFARPASAKAAAGEEKRGLFHRECKKCEELKKESAEFKAGWQRATADYQNLKKETEARRGEWARMSEAQILEEFIPVYENFKAAFSHLPLPEGESAEGRRGWEQWTQGIEHIKKQFAEILKAHGVEEIKTVGEKFDPKYHEAAGHEAVEGKSEGEIVKEVSGGYKMGERVIRAARVIVAK